MSNRAANEKKNTVYEQQTSAYVGTQTWTSREAALMDAHTHPLIHAAHKQTLILVEFLCKEVYAINV